MCVLLLLPHMREFDFYRGHDMANEIYLTIEGKKQLEEKLDYYKKVKRVEATKAIGIARDFGDLKENSEYDQAKEEQAKIEAEIAEMEATLRDAIVIAKKVSTSKVNIGNTVKVYDEDFDETIQYKIVGSAESDPLRGLISNQSPVGAALLGKEKGDEICVPTPSGHVKLKILDIK